MVRGDYMQRLMRLEDVAALTRQPPRRLRQWCATGQLECEPAGTSWEIGESQVPRISALAGQPGRLPGGRRAAALALPSSAAGPSLVRQVAQRLRLAESDLALATVALDGVELTLVVWPERSQENAGPALAGLADELEGELLDGSEAAMASEAPLAPDRFPPALRSTRKPAFRVPAGRAR
jgi:hypothetical protein